MRLPEWWKLTWGNRSLITKSKGVRPSRSQIPRPIRCYRKQQQTSRNACQHIIITKQHDQIITQCEHHNSCNPHKQLTQLVCRNSCNEKLSTVATRFQINNARWKLETHYTAVKMVISPYLNHPSLNLMKYDLPTCNLTVRTITHTHTHSVLTAIFPGEPGLASCPLNFPSPFIPGLRILLG